MNHTVFLLPNGLAAHCSGAVLVSQSKTLLIADLHLGYSWAQRRRGELGPLADARTRAKLLEAVEELTPNRIVFLGDLVHAPRPCQAEREWIEQILVELSTQAELISVRGNHDRAFAKEFGHLPVRTVESWSEEEVLAIHGDELPAPVAGVRTLVLGHLHPSFPVRDAAGALQRLPVFLATSRCVVLPAFSPFARGFDVACGLPDDLLPHFGTEEIQAYAATSTRVAHLGPLYRALERMFQADGHAPAQFRRRRA